MAFRIKTKDGTLWLPMSDVVGVLEKADGSGVVYRRGSPLSHCETLSVTDGAAVAQALRDHEEKSTPQVPLFEAIFGK